MLLYLERDHLIDQLNSVWSNSAQTIVLGAITALEEGSRQPAVKDVIEVCFVIESNLIDSAPSVKLTCKAELVSQNARLPASRPTDRPTSRHTVVKYQISLSYFLPLFHNKQTFLIFNSFTYQPASLSQQADDQLLSGT